MDQGSTRKRSAVHNFAPTVTKFCAMWEGQALPHDTKFGNSRCKIVGRRVIFIWSLIHGSSWSGLINAEPDQHQQDLSEHCSWPSCIWPRELQPQSKSCKGRHQRCPCLKRLRRSNNIWAVLSVSIVLQDIHGHQRYLVGLPCVLDMMPIKNRLGMPICEHLTEDRQCQLILWNCYLQYLSAPEQVLGFTPSPAEHSQPLGGIYPQFGMPQHHHKPVFP